MNVYHGRTASAAHLSCTVLFERRAEKYLDAECLAMLGWQLFIRLRKAAKR
jgi:hypothetical protein